MNSQLAQITRQIKSNGVMDTNNFKACVVCVSIIDYRDVNLKILNF